MPIGAILLFHRKNFAVDKDIESLLAESDQRFKSMDQTQDITRLGTLEDANASTVTNENLIRSTIIRSILQGNVSLERQRHPS